MTDEDHTEDGDETDYEIAGVRELGVSLVGRIAMARNAIQAMFDIANIVNTGTENGPVSSETAKHDMVEVLRGLMMEAEYQLSRVTWIMDEMGPEDDNQEDDNNG